MEDVNVGLLFWICFGWFFLRQVIVKYKPIPKWIDIPIVIVLIIFTMYASYDTFI